MKSQRKKQRRCLEFIKNIDGIQSSANNVAVMSRSVASTLLAISSETHDQRGFLSLRRSDLGNLLHEILDGLP
jgi:hypothetical protein